MLGLADSLTQDSVTSPWGCPHLPLCFQKEKPSNFLSGGSASSPLPGAASGCSLSGGGGEADVEEILGGGEVPNVGENTRLPRHSPQGRSVHGPQGRSPVPLEPSIPQVVTGIDPPLPGTHRSMASQHTVGIGGQQSAGAQRLPRGKGFAVRRTGVRSLAGPCVSPDNLFHLSGRQSSHL